MPDPNTQILFWVLPTFTVLVSLGVLITFALMIWEFTPSVIDVGIITLIGALIAARLFHVVLDWQYFSAHTDEILRLTAGGLNWHGAVIGGLIGLYAAAQWRKIPAAAILDRMTVALPLLMLTAWWGCGAAACAYGAEIQNLASYPSWMVWEERDIYGLIYPRYATQPLGMMLANVLLLIALVLVGGGWLKGRRFGLMLALVSLSMLALGFLRGDTAYPLLDLVILSIGLLYARIDNRRLPEPSAP